MINDIRIHLHENDEAQLALEKESVELIHNRHSSSVNAFNRRMPSVASTLSSIATRNISIFCNFNKEFNIVDYGTGKVFYGLHPQDEVICHVQSWAEKPVYVNIKPDVDRNEEAEPDDKRLNKTLNTLIVLGLGGGSTFSI
ncbi:MAG: hypothetical protein GJ680_19965 [Alteromonadaceae bacterium]|nr:hypothetical protein [Alteromonadaceae bacterium]